MHDTWTIDVIWWITAVELPALAGLFWLNWRNRQDAGDESDAVRYSCENGMARLRESLSAYKLEVAKSYASLGYLKEVEQRLTSHLIRIEDKLGSAGHGGGL
ncbi:MAG: hypothetical protein A3G18_10360 [Rhodospirillales bacterium RIFCSPLOWO2_12_FULL_58_28]|nr:MAG: hypothetical protein A3H92_08535 [Rhodospirillales bacterium RIFCSPLOWO2_02_FULL_58_16]OHC77680.1 MAG: hypothetical protein A3G18_10360 [Rhodospirillales bacterium RIFCSPLOWO2_12_FULL_58_28]